MTVLVPSKEHIQRRVFGRTKDLIGLPDLVEVQKNSYRWFFQAEKEADSRESQGLQEILEEIFPIESYDGSFALEFVRYFVDESPITEEEARQFEESVAVFETIDESPEPQGTAGVPR